MPGTRKGITRVGIPRGKRNISTDDPHHSNDQWLSQTERTDGLTLSETTAGHWAINHNNLTHVVCPGCRRVLNSARSARLAADIFFPTKSIT